MASPKQIAANRRNAGFSTGPKTEEGKAASRGNAIKHGLSGAGVALSADVRSEVDARLDQWADDLPSDSPRRRWLAAQTVVESIRVDRCQRQFFELCNDHADRAGHSWDDDRRKEAELTFGRIKANPGLTRLELLATRHGCERLIEAWGLLGQAIDDHGDWNDDQRHDALDLLGHPVGYRDGTTFVDPGAVEDRGAYRREFVLRQVAELKARIESGLGRSDRQARRAAAETAVGAELTGPVRTILRLETGCQRRLRQAIKDLAATDPEPATAPVETIDELEAEDETETVETEADSEEIDAVILSSAVPARAFAPTDAETVVHGPIADSMARRLDAATPGRTHPAGNRRERRAAKAMQRGA